MVHAGIVPRQTDRCVTIDIVNHSDVSAVGGYNRHSRSDFFDINHDFLLARARRRLGGRM